MITAKILAAGESFGKDLNNACVAQGIFLSENMLAAYTTAFLSTCQEKGLPNAATQAYAIEQIIEDLKNHA